MKIFTLFKILFYLNRLQLVMGSNLIRTHETKLTMKQKDSIAIRQRRCLIIYIYLEIY